jgi:LysM repeat protein
MNTPNPLIPQGTFLEQKSKSHFRIAVFTILAVHVVLIGSFLLAGCKRTTDTATGEQTNDLVSAYPTPPAFPPTDTSTPTPTTATDIAAVNVNTGATAVPPLPSNPIPGTSEPPPVPDTTAFPPATQGEHVIVKGDLLATIAKKYGVTLRALQDANPGVDPARLKIGQKLTIPARTMAATTAAPTAPANATANGTKTYTVKSGDTLVKIARTHGVTIKELQSANNLRTTQIKVGQKLRIPSKGGTPDAIGTPGVQ